MKIGKRLLIPLIVISIFLQGCTTPYGLRGSASFNSTSDHNQLNIQANTLADNPCDETKRRQSAIGAAILGGIGGAIGGAVVFLVIGKALGLGDRAVANLAKAGAVGGGVVGSRISYDNTVDAYRRQCEIYKLSTMRTTKSDFITLVKNNDLLGDISVIPDQGHFFHRSASLTASGKKYYSALAKSYTDDAQLKSYEQVIRNSAGTSKSDQANKLRNYKSSQADDAKLKHLWANMRLVLTGHTDDHMPIQDAIRLSEQRALTIAQLFKQNGVRENILLYQGAGAAYPIADNSNAEGRKLNNRVEVVAIYHQNDIQGYLNQRYPDIGLRTPNYAPIQSPSHTTKASPASSSTQVTSSATTERRAAQNRPTSTTKVNPAPSVSPKYTSIPGDDNQKNGLSNSLANNASSEPATIQSSTLKVDNPIPGIDFGGMKYVAGMDLAQWDVVARLGKIKEPNGFSLAGLLGISKAYAATPKNNLPQNCWNDSPQRYNTATGEIKSLASKQTVAVKRYLDSSETYMGYDKGELGANIGTHYFRVSNLSLRADGKLMSSPTISVYKEFQTLGDNAQQISLKGTVFAVRGDNGMLVRHFFDKSQGPICMDLLLSNASKTARKESNLLYQKSGELWLVGLPLVVPKKS